MEITNLKIDVAVMTRNSARFLEKCLYSIEKEVNLNKLIIVDGGSVDNTLEIARKHNATILFDNGKNLGYARKLAIKNIRTTWFAFIDSDVVLTKNWQKKMMSINLKNIGAIQSTAINALLPGEESVTRVHNKLMRRRHKYAKIMTGKSARGFTGATILNHKVVSDIVIPDIPCSEDWVITQHVLSKGYLWISMPVEVLHYDRFSERPERIRQTHAMGRVLGYMTFKWLTWRMIRVFIARLFMSIANRNIAYLYDRIGYTINAYEGWLHPNKYIHLKYAGWDANGRKNN